MASVSFDRIADRYDATRGGLERGRWLAGEISTRLASGTVLEIGVGTGAIAQPLRDLGHDVVGIDVSPSMLALAWPRVGPVLVTADGYHLPVAAHSVRNVVLVWVLQLVPDITGLLAEAHRALVDAGTLVAVVAEWPPDLDEIETIVAPMRDALRPPADRPALVIAAAEQAGFRLESSITLRRDWRTSPEEQARLTEQRTYSYLIDLPEEQWQDVVAPAIRALRALPDPQRRRTRTSAQEMLTFSAVPSTP